MLSGQRWPAFMPTLSGATAAAPGADPDQRRWAAASPRRSSAVSSLVRLAGGSELVLVLAEQLPAGVDVDEQLGLGGPAGRLSGVAAPAHSVAGAHGRQKRHDRSQDPQ